MTNPADPSPDEGDVAPAAGPTDLDEADTTGHSMANYEFARQMTRERSRETNEWARAEKARRESRGLIDRLRRK